MLASIPHTQGYLSRVHFVFADYEHVRHLHELRLPDLGIHTLRADIGMRPDALLAQLPDDAVGIFILPIRDRDDAHLFRREPDREVSGVMLDQEPDHALVGG